MLIIQTTVGRNNLTIQIGVKSFLFCFGCSMKADRILMWPKKDGFYIIQHHVNSGCSWDAFSGWPGKMIERR